jgi:hypothetical protein
MKKFKLLFAIVLVVVLCLAVVVGCAEQGIQGEQGEQGIQGPQGLQGIQGERGNGAREINIYVTHGTLPTLYAGLHAMLNPATEAYMMYERVGTFNNVELGKHTNIKQFFNGFEGADFAAFRAKIKELYNADNDAIFNLFCDDLRVQTEITLFLAQGIPYSNYAMTLLTDGVGSYHGSGAGAFPYAPANNFDLFLTNARIYSDHFAQAATVGTTTLDLSLINHSMSRNAIFAAQRQDVRYWLQFPEHLESADVQVMEQIALSNIEKVTPVMLFNRLSPVAKQAFAAVANLNTEYFDTLFFNDNGKKNLIISGTSVAGEAGNFENVLDEIIRLFGDDYNLFFKAHPTVGNWPENIAGRVDLLESNGFYILPSVLPMEVLMWFYPHLYVGGYSSSLYMSVNRFQTLFFVLPGANPANLGTPLFNLFEAGWFDTIDGDTPEIISITIGI